MTIINKFLEENFKEYKLLDITKCCKDENILLMFLNRGLEKKYYNMIFILHKTKDNENLFKFYVKGDNCDFVLLNKDNYMTLKNNKITKKVIEEFLNNNDKCSLCTKVCDGGYRCLHCGNLVCLECYKYLIVGVLGKFKKEINCHTCSNILTSF